MPRGLLLFALAAAAAGCTRNHTLGVRITGVDAAAAGFEAYLVGGGTCDPDPGALAGAILDGVAGARGTSFREPPTGALFTDVGDGAARLLVLVRDASCQPIQAGCVVFRAGEGDGPVVVAVRDVPTTLPACAACEAGLCAGPTPDGGLDAGVDAGPFDAGPDAQIDAGCGLDGPALPLDCADDAECGPGRCASMRCVDVPIARASGLMRPPAAHDFGDELSLLVSDEWGDGYLQHLVGLADAPRDGSDPTPQIWALRGSSSDASALVLDDLRPYPAVPNDCRVRETPEIPGPPLVAARHLVLGGRAWPLHGVIATVEGEPAMAMGLAQPIDGLIQACERLPGRTLQGPVVRAGDEKSDHTAYASYVWVEREAGTTYLGRYEWGTRLGRTELPATELDGIGAAACNEGFHVVYELAPNGPVFMWDSIGLTPGVELPRPGALGPPALAGLGPTEYVLAYPVTTDDCAGQGVILREVACAPACDYTGRQATLRGRIEHVALTRLEEGGFVLAGVDVDADRVVAAFLNDDFEAVPIEGEAWIDVRAVLATDEVRVLRLATARDCTASPPVTHVTLAALVGPRDGAGPPSRVYVDALRYEPPDARCPAP